MKTRVSRRSFVRIGTGLMLLPLGVARARSEPPAPAKGTLGPSTLRILTEFEGSCPHSPKGIQELAPNRFRILPSWRASHGVSEEAVGRSTRLGFRVLNERQATEHVELLIDWQYNDAPPKDRPGFASVAEFMSFRDFVVVQWPGRTDWQTVMADVDGTIARLVLQIPPGQTEIHWHPPYTYSQSEQFVASLRANPLVAVEQIGQSEEGRNLWMVKITDGSSLPKKPVMIRARVHAYESAGSYAMEGMVRWLLSGEPYSTAALHEYAFYVMPMANPDGVANGLGRLTSPQGADLVWVVSKPDRAHTAINQAVDRVRPIWFIDLHNWQNKRTDGLLGLDPEIRKHFLRFMPDQLEFGKQWMIREPWPIPPTPPPQEFVSMHCRRKFGASTVSFEFPWFGRTVDDVRAVGRRALWALLRAVDELRGGSSTR